MLHRSRGTRARRPKSRDVRRGLRRAAACHAPVRRRAAGDNPPHDGFVRRRITGRGDAGVYLPGARERSRRRPLSCGDGNRLAGGARCYIKRHVCAGWVEQYSRITWLDKEAKGR